MQKQNSSNRTIQYLFNLWRISPLGCLGMIITQAAYVIMSSVIAPIYISKLLTNISTGTATMENSIGLLIGYALMLVIGSVVMFRITIALAYKVETKMQATVELAVFEHLCNKSLDFHSNRMSGGIVSDNSKLNSSVERFWDTIGFTATPVMTTVVAICIALSFIMWQFAIALGILSIVVILIIIKVQMSIAPVSQEVAKKSSALTSHIADTIGNISAVKAFAQEKTEQTKFNNLIGDWIDANNRQMKSVLLVTGTFSTLMAIMNICAFAAAVLATEYHLANIGSIYLVISYTISVVSQLWSVSGATRSYIRIVGDAAPMINTLDEKIEITDHVNPLESNIHDGKIEFEKICFTHKEQKHPLFKDFSLTINPGEQIGLVGKSGSGKTSLTRLLLRFSELDNGQIAIDSQNIAEITQNDLRKSIAYVPQEPMLFHRSIRENIAYGNQSATDKEIIKAAKQANAFDFINDLPNGLDTTVGERGVKLSGGQRQRVAIARALLKDAPILVLDEATSALDSENEQLIQDAIWKLMAGRTSIVIAHRLSTIAQLDRIIVLDNGKIVEQGKHSELLAKNGTYAKLWAHQSGGFIEE